MTRGAPPRPPEPPVDIPEGVLHGTRKAYRKFVCRCLPCQEWSREDDRNRPSRIRPDPHPERGWYVCATRWGVTYAEHEYNREGVCLRDGADRETEEYWERKWSA